MEHQGEQSAVGTVGTEVEPTGVDQVDGVLAEVAGLADRPVTEHVEVFERAHERLRRALDATPPAAAAAPDERGA